MSELARAYRYAVNVTPKPGILDPQGKAVERSLPHLGITGVTGARTR
jgi:phosphoribosylformylglycinamidine (FGAM) synthase PurS component